MMTLKSLKLVHYLMAFIGICCLLWFLKSVFLKPLGHYLIYDSLPSKTKLNADVAIVLTGGSGNRIKKAIELYHEKKAKHIIISGNEGKSTIFPPKQVEIKKYAIKSGVNENHIFLEQEATSTYENALYSLKLCEKLNYKKIIIVTNKFHSKRAYSIFKKLNTNSSVTIYSKTAKDHINYNNWWTNHNMTETVLIEWGKTVWYWLKY